MRFFFVSRKQNLWYIVIDLVKYLIYINFTSFKKKFPFHFKYVYILITANIAIQKIRIMFQIDICTFLAVSKAIIAPHTSSSVQFRQFLLNLFGLVELFRFFTIRKHGSGKFRSIRIRLLFAIMAESIQNNIIAGKSAFALSLAR